MNDPYVPTNRGWRRKIGPASKFRFNMPQEEAPSRFSRGDLRGSGRETNFQVSLREARELSEANAAIERREKQRTNQAKRAEEAKKSTAAPSIAEKNAASVAAFGSGKAPAATQAAPAAPVMSREERNKIEEERRAKGRAKAEAERPGSLKAKLEEARSPVAMDIRKVPSAHGGQERVAGVGREPHEMANAAFRNAMPTKTSFNKSRRGYPFRH